jgi:hypothetical protein
MSKIDDLDAAEPFSLSLNLGEVDLASVPKELQEDDVTWEARHHSHHSYRTHGTATW